MERYLGDVCKGNLTLFMAEVTRGKWLNYSNSNRSRIKTQDPTMPFPATAEMAEALQRGRRQMSLTSASYGPRALSLRNEVLILAFLPNSNVGCYIQPEAAIGQVVPPSHF